MSLPIGQTTHTATSAAAATGATTAIASPATSAATEQQFLKLLIAQLKHQDPTQPMKGTEFVAQLAQFSLVEQSVAQSKQLGNLTAQVTGVGNNETTQLVGKNVTIRGNGISFDGTIASPTNVTLSGPAAQVQATITDASGNVIRTINMGPHAAGVMTIPWDGRNNSGQVVPKGTYSINASASDSSGGSISVSQNVSGIVNSVSFDKGYPVLTLASGAQAPISELVSVGTTTTSP